MATQQTMNGHPDAAAQQAGARKPMRHLLIGGGLLLTTALVFFGTTAWYALNTVENGFDDAKRAWVHADAVMEMNIDSLKSNWALTLHGAGNERHAQRVFRDAVTRFSTQAQRAVAAGVVEAGELDEAIQVFAGIEDMTRELIGGSDPSVASRALQDDLVMAQEQLDDLMVELEIRGDETVEMGWSRARDSVTGLIKMSFLAGVVGLFLWVGLAAYLIRRVVAGLGRPVTRISSATSQLTDAAQYQVKSAMEQASAAIEISTTMQELLASYNNLTERSKDMVQISRAAADECHKGHEYLDKSQTGIGQIKVEVERIADHMRTMEDKTQQINSVLEIINDMASQTNLLSINATIEAAGAGEAGRRFSVVAEEIRLLAERAVESTEEIRTLIDDIQETARVTNVVTQEGERAVDRGLQDAARVADNFNTLLALVTQTVDAVQTIEATAREQGNAVAQVSSAVESLTNTSSESEKHSADTLTTVNGLAQTADELMTLAGVSKNYEEPR